MMFGTTRFSFRDAIVGAVAMTAVAGWAGGVSAQEQEKGGDAMQLVASSVDCRYALRPVDTAICSTPVLAAMDIQMMTLFNVLNVLVKPEVNVEMAAAQQEYLKEREACSADVTCIGEVTAKRIADLDNVLKQIAAGGPY